MSDVSYPDSWPDWVPQQTGIQETRKPWRHVPADVLQSYDATKLWLAKRPDVNRPVFGTAWIRWLCRDLKAARLSALEASRALKAMRAKMEKVKRRTAGTVGASEKESSKCTPNIRTKASRCKPNAATR